MTEHQLYMWVVWIWLGLAAFTFVSLFFFTAPYGRHARAGWGPMIERTAAWMIMESPVVFLPLILFLVSDRRALVPYGIFLLIWEFHYVHRTFVFPFRLRGGQPQMPLSIVARRAHEPVLRSRRAARDAGADQDHRGRNPGRS